MKRKFTFSIKAVGEGPVEEAGVILDELRHGMASAQAMREARFGAIDRVPPPVAPAPEPEPGEAPIGERLRLMNGQLNTLNMRQVETGGLAKRAAEGWDAYGAKHDRLEERVAKLEAKASKKRQPKVPA